jgi:hypothetical protein
MQTADLIDIIFGELLIVSQNYARLRGEIDLVREERERRPENIWILLERLFRKNSLRALQFPILVQADEFLCK